MDQSLTPFPAQLHGGQTTTVDRKAVPDFQSRRRGSRLHDQPYPSRLFAYRPDGSSFLNNPGEHVRKEIRSLRRDFLDPKSGHGRRLAVGVLELIGPRGFVELRLAPRGHDVVVRKSHIVVPDATTGHKHQPE